MARESFFYLASPYSGYPAGLDAAFRAACTNAALLVAAGIPVFCPIAHFHPIAKHGSLDPVDHTIWLPADRPMMDAAHGLIVLMLESWRESVGVAHEIKIFESAGKPVTAMVPGEVPRSLRAAVVEA